MKILGDVFEKEFKSISAVIRLASQVQTYPDKTVAQKVTKMLNESLLPKLKILGNTKGTRYVKFLIENFLKFLFLKHFFAILINIFY